MNCDACAKTVAALDDPEVRDPDAVGEEIFCRVVELPDGSCVNEYRRIRDGGSPASGTVIHRCAGFAAVAGEAAPLPTEPILPAAEVAL